MRRCPPAKLSAIFSFGVHIVDVRFSSTGSKQPSLRPKSFGNRLLVRPHYCRLTATIGPNRNLEIETLKIGLASRHTRTRPSEDPRKPLQDSRNQTPGGPRSLELNWGRRIQIYTSGGGPPRRPSNVITTSSNMVLCNVL